MSPHHYPEPASAAREMARVLARGGRVVIGDGTSDAVVMKVADFILQKFEPGHVHFHRAEDLRCLLEDAGLERTEARSVWRGIYGVALARKAG